MKGCKKCGKSEMDGRYICECDRCGLVLCQRCHPSLSGSYCPNCNGKELNSKKGWYLR